MEKAERAERNLTAILQEKEILREEKSKLYNEKLCKILNDKEKFIQQNSEKLLNDLTRVIDCRFVEYFKVVAKIFCNFSTL
jgi:hypothetical protein